MKITANASGVLAIVAVGVVGFLAFKAYRAGQGIVDAVSGAASDAADWIEQRAAGVTEAWTNATSAPASGGDPTKAALYSDEGYAGIDPVTGANATAGEWFTSEQARQYEYESQAEYERLRRPSPVVGPNGAAFGVYPRP